MKDMSISGGAMKRMIAIVDLQTGAVTSRSSDTRTLDLPVDFDPETAIAELDGRSHALYRSTRGKEVSALVHPRPLSWRVHGEECLVANEGPAAGGRFTLCQVEQPGPGSR
jgi:hypothetical protein